MYGTKCNPERLNFIHFIKQIDYQLKYKSITYLNSSYVRINIRNDKVLSKEYQLSSFVFIFLVRYCIPLNNSSLIDLTIRCVIKLI